MGVVIKPTESRNLHAKRNLHINENHTKDPDLKTKVGPQEEQATSLQL